MAINTSIIWELTKRDFTERFAGSVLGSVWSFILPLVNLFIYFIIFSRLMGSRLPGSNNVYAYGVYLSVGLIPWTALSNSIVRGSTVFIDKKNIISKIKVSLPSLLVYINISETITFLIIGALLAVVMALTGFRPSIHILLIPFIYYLQLVFSFSVGLFCAVFTVFLRDLREIVGVVMQLWFWFTPIVYVSSILPEPVKKLLVLNPAFIIIEAYQRVTVFHDMPSIKSLIVLTVLTHLFLLVSYMLFRGLEKDVRDFL